MANPCPDATEQSPAAAEAVADRGSNDAPVVTRWVRVSVAPAGRETTRSHRAASEAQCDSPERTVLTFAASTEAEDRAGDVVAASGWNLEAFRRNPVFLWAHRHDEPPIGRVLETWVDGRSLMAKVEFAPTPFAQEVAALYRGGYLSGVSVGFRALAVERRKASNGRPATRFVRQELLELSAAPVPLNAEALLAERNLSAANHDVARGLVPRRGVGDHGVGARRAVPAESEELGLMADVARLWQGVANVS